MGIKLTNIDQVEAWSGGQILPPGRHTVRIEKAEEGTSSGGHPQVELEFVDLDGFGSIRDWLVFTEGTLGKARMLLDAVGISPQSGEWEFPTEQLIDKKLIITVAEEPDNRDPSKTRRRVVAYEPTDGSTANGGPAPGGTADDSDLPF